MKSTKLYRTLRLLVLVPLARLRFVFILGAIGLAIAKWDWLVGHYEKWAHAGAETHAASDVEFFCPMHPSIVRDHGKEKCPICFMPLSKRKKGDEADEALPAGTVARVQLTPYRVVLAGVQTASVDYHPLRRDITTVGTVEFDERGLKTVAARFKGRIEKLFVNQTGQWVRKGDPLAMLYSPDLVVTVQNLLDARQAKSPELEKTARDRLKLWGVEADQVDEIVASGKPITQLAVRSPIDGHVLKKFPREGQYVDEGGPLYDVADLSTVWIQAQLYEDDLPFLPKGHDPKTGAPLQPVPVSATARGLPGEAFDGKLSFIFPHVDPDSRTLTVRYEVQNPDHALRPGMTTTVKLRIDPATRLGKRLQTKDAKVLAVPEASVIDTGTQTLVFREYLPHTYDSVLVDLGPRLVTASGASYFPVYTGLQAGDRIVTTGSFLLDAETRLNPAMGSIYIGGSGGGGKSAPAVRPTTPDDTETAITAALGKLAPADRERAKEQRFCPILDGSRLGSMGVPAKVNLNGTDVFVCCKGCVEQAVQEADRTLERVKGFRSKSSRPDDRKARGAAAVAKALAELPPADRAEAERQRLCPVTGQALGSMGRPSRISLDGLTVFTCCESCDETVRERPAEIRKKVESLRGTKPK